MGIPVSKQLMNWNNVKVMIEQMKLFKQWKHTMWQINWTKQNAENFLRKRSSKHNTSTMTSFFQ